MQNLFRSLLLTEHFQVEEKHFQMQEINIVLPCWLVSTNCIYLDFVGCKLIHN